MKPEFFRASLLALCSALALAACVSSSMAPVEDRSSGSSAAATQPAAPGYHVVQKGETLYRISLEHGQDYREVAAWNNLTEPYLISIGQSLRIWPPGATGGAAVSTAPVAGGATVEQRTLDGTVGSGRPTSRNTERVKRDPMGDKEPYSDARYAVLSNSTLVTTAPQGTPAAPPAQTPAPSGTPSLGATTPAPAMPVAPAVPVPAASGTAAAATASVVGITWSWPADGRIVGNFAQSKGVDISGKAGDPVRAAADGKVVYTGNSLRGFGNLVIVKHNNEFLTAYAHNQKILVKEGQNVKRGAQIAEMGNSDSDAVKLHFEVRRQGTPVEPLNYLPKK